MLTDFLANIRGKFVIDIGGQLAQDAQTSAFPMSVWPPSRGSLPLRFGRATLCHMEQSLRYPRESWLWSMSGSPRLRALR
jgi:hypothetical protein